jgi:hypothetical protein
MQPQFVSEPSGLWALASRSRAAWRLAIAQVTTPPGCHGGKSSLLCRDAEPLGLLPDTQSGVRLDPIHQHPQE